MCTWKMLFYHKHDLRYYELENGYLISYKQWEIISPGFRCNFMTFGHAVCTNSIKGKH